MNKKMVEIKVINGGFNPYIDLIEVDNIRKKVGSKVDEEKAKDAINVIIAYLAEGRYEKVIIDIDELEDSYKPAKKMTVGEIEKELGYKIEIVREKEN